VALVFSDLALLAFNAADELIRKGPMPSIPRPDINHSHENLDRLIEQLAGVSQNSNGDMVLGILRRARHAPCNWSTQNQNLSLHSDIVEGVATCLRLVKQFSSREDCVSLSSQPAGEELGYLFFDI
tara:strand:- start:17499 stop:17876 length:378 start_codon:yes stop_codon:yes gene_type:complete